MDLDMDNNKHYILTDAAGVITDGWSDGPLRERDTAGAICINDQGGYQFRLSPGGEENPPLYTMDGIPLYRWDGAQVVPRTEAEIEQARAELPPPPPSPMEQLLARLEALEGSQTAPADGSVWDSLAAAYSEGVQQA